MGFSATSGSKTHEEIGPNLGVSNYVGDPTLTSKYTSDGACVGGLGACVNLLT